MISVLCCYGIIYNLFILYILYILSVCGSTVNGCSDFGVDWLKQVFNMSLAGVRQRALTSFVRHLPVAAGSSRNSPRRSLAVDEVESDQSLTVTVQKLAVPNHWPPTPDVRKDTKYTKHTKYELWKFDIYQKILFVFIFLKLKILEKLKCIVVFWVFFAL